MTEGVVEDSSGSNPSPGYHRYSTVVLAFFFHAILFEAPLDEVNADLDEELDDEAGLGERLGDEAEADLGAELGSTAEADLVGDSTT